MPHDTDETRGAYHGNVSGCGANASLVTIPDFGEARFLLRRQAPEAAARWQASREAVEEAWRNGAEAALTRLSSLEEQIESLARDPNLRRNPAARAGVDRALDARRKEREAIRDSRELRRYREAKTEESAAREALAEAARYQWREYEARLARLRRQYPGKWAEYEAEERAAGRDPVSPHPSASVGLHPARPPADDE